MRKPDLHLLRTGKNICNTRILPGSNRLNFERKRNRQFRQYERALSQVMIRGRFLNSFRSPFWEMAIRLQILSSGMKILAVVSLKIPSSAWIFDVGGRQFLAASDNCSNNSCRMRIFRLGRKAGSFCNYKFIHGWKISCIHHNSVQEILQIEGNPGWSRMSRFFCFVISLVRWKFHRRSRLTSL